MTRNTRKCRVCNLGGQQKWLTTVIGLSIWSVVSLVFMVTWHVVHTDQTRSTQKWIPGNVDTVNNIKPHKGQDVGYKRIFEANKPHQLLILSYQRCGSSFFGDIFGKHPGVMYMYEPLDGLYSHLYGTQEGWNVPSDMNSYHDGSFRYPPVIELQSVTQLLNDILNCNISNIPTTVLYNKFWELFRKRHSSLSEFTDCYQNNSLNRVETCRKTILADVCPSRFNPDTVQLGFCRSRLERVRRNRISRVPQFNNYIECLNEIRTDASQCDAVLQRTCMEKQFRAVKTVRATMESVEQLIVHNPNLRVIHLIRDPRPVVISRTKFGNSSYGVSSMISANQTKQMNLTNEARLYCNTVVRDIRKRKQLQTIYPNTILELIYEDFIRSPMKTTEMLYKFIDVSFPESLQLWLNNSLTDSKKIVKHWQYKLTYAEAAAVRFVCRELFHEVPQKWPE